MSRAERRVRERLAQRTVEGFPGVTTGPGWDNLLALVDDGIAKLAPSYELLYASAVNGTLHYRTSVDELPGVEWLLEVARDVAAVTCEQCGRDGYRRVNVVRCDACYASDWRVSRDDDERDEQRDAES